MKLDFDRDLRIDETALDVECLEQPSLMMAYAQEAAEARMEMDTAKESLDVIEAQVDSEVRDCPEDFGLKKITESAIKSAVVLDERVQAAKKRLTQAKLDYGMTTAASVAMDARKKMLEMLIQLHGQQYFAGPKTPRNLMKEAKKRFASKSSNEKVKKAMDRRKKKED